MILIYVNNNQHFRETTQVYINCYSERYHPNHNIFLRLIGSLQTHRSFSNKNF